jgi:predicted dithiol-disulfide oxidoreductase (DUF899 family)
MKTSSTVPPRTATREQWLADRQALLRQEKEFNRLRDQLSARRRELPWVRIDQDYTFDSSAGRVSLAGLFDGKSQLIVYHFMLAPGWEEGCRGCSFVADHFDGAIPHLGARDIAFAAVSTAPLPEILAFRQRMGWRFKWVSSAGTRFNHDYHVTFTPAEMAAETVTYNYSQIKPRMEELPGLSVFARDAAGAVYHTYSTYSRGLDLLIGAYNLIDLVPKGRDEAGLEQSSSWVRHHDRYEPAGIEA